MAVIGDERLSLTCRSERNSRADTLEPRRGRMPSERHDFYCDGTLDDETVDELRRRFGLPRTADRPVGPPGTGRQRRFSFAV